MLTGYVVGAFDLFNVRDLDVISQIRDRCGRVVVGVLTDDQVGRLHGRPPVVPLDERLQLIAHVRGVDDAVVHQTTYAQDGSLALFAIEHEPLPTGVEAPTWITPRRESRCEAVRQTTSRTSEQAVA